MRKNHPRTVIPSSSVRIDLDTQGRIGPGKIQLLENIHSCGSISAASRAMGMSYMRGRETVERQKGGQNGGGATLTPFGFMLVARYRRIEHTVESAVREELRGLCADIGAS